MHPVVFLLVLPALALGNGEPCSSEVQDSYHVTVTPTEALSCALDKLNGCGEVILTQDEKDALDYFLYGIGAASFFESVTRPSTAAAGAGCTANCPKGSCSCGAGTLCICKCSFLGFPKCGGGSLASFATPQSSQDP